MAKTFQLKDLMSNNDGDGDVHDNFRDALRDLYARIKDVNERGLLNYQWLESIVWIEMRDKDTGLVGPIYFYEARDIAFQHDLVNECGDINDDGQEPDSDMLVKVALLCAAQGNAKEYIEGFKKVA